jgi:hypothetical protein
LSINGIHGLRVELDLPLANLQMSLKHGMFNKKMFYSSLQASRKQAAQELNTTRQRMLAQARSSPSCSSEPEQRSDVNYTNFLDSLEQEFQSLVRAMTLL